MGENYISEAKFADALINYVQKSNTQLKDTDRTVPDHWVTLAEREINNSSYWDPHGDIYGTFFDSNVLIPGGWYDFQRQYRTAEAELVERICAECKIQGVTDWTPENVRRNNIDSKSIPESNYKRIIGCLKERGLITKPSRIYSDDPKAFGLIVGNKIVDFPGSYDYLDYLRRSKNMNVMSPDFPNKIEKYGEIVPVAFMVGKTIDIDDKYSGKQEVGVSPKQELFQLIAENTMHDLKCQSIMYVFAEKEGEMINPRKIGRMKALVLDVEHGSPVGHILNGHEYLVPQNDMAYEKSSILNISNDNWKMHLRNLQKDHSEIINFDA